MSAGLSSDPHHWDLRLVLEHFPLLMDRRREVAERASWRDIQVYGCHASVAFLGGGRFALGPLLQAWSDYRLTTPRDGRPVYVYEVAGTVGGRGGAFALDPARDEVVRVGHVVDWMDRASTKVLEAKGKTAWSLGQLLATWGVAVPDIALRDGEAVLGRYVHADATLFDAGDRPVARFDFPLPADAPPLETSWPPVPGSALVTVERVGITRDGPAPREIAFDGPLPPPVAGAAAAWLYRAGLL